jgi:hypothetical protein
MTAAAYIAARAREELRALGFRLADSHGTVRQGGPYVHIEEWRTDAGDLRLLYVEQSQRAVTRAVVFEPREEIA